MIYIFNTKFDSGCRCWLLKPEEKAKLELIQYLQVCFDEFLVCHKFELLLPFQI